MRTVNVHEAKTQFSRLIDAAHAGETIVVAKDGKPWARLVPLEIDRPRRQPGLLRGQLQLPAIEELLAPLPPEELDSLDASLPYRWLHPSCWTPMPCSGGWWNPRSSLP
jgi:prevent-host-death family protein